MHKFGSTGLVTGYIKQLLATFNLPKTRIYSKEYEKFYEEHHVESPYVLESFDDLNLIVPEASRVLLDKYPTVKAEIEACYAETRRAIQESQTKFSEWLTGATNPTSEEIFNKNQELNAEIKKAQADEAIKLEQILQNLDTQTLNLRYVAQGAYRTGELSQVVQKSYIPYIKDGRIQFLRGGYYNSDAQFIPGEWQSEEIDVNKTAGGLWQVYDRGKHYLNLTKRLQIKNNIYDSYTHEYLGEYLRFIRDFDGIDLMPLYNCFSNNIWPGGNKIALETVNSVFDAADSQYKIYMVPVKLFKNYTIALDSDSPIEITCGCFNVASAAGEVFTQLYTKTYLKKTQTRFNQPFLYTALADLAPQQLSDFPQYSELVAHAEARQFLAQLAPRESELKLFLKVPKNVTSSIVILEGDYRNWNDQVVSKVQTIIDGEIDTKMALKHNHTVLDNQVIFSDTELPLITPLQLLKINTGVQMPFANRLLEYLLDGCITGGDAEVRENVLMAQTLAGLRYDGSIEKGDYYAKQIKGANEVRVTKIIKIKSSEAACTKLGDLCFQRILHSDTPLNPHCKTSGYCQHIKRLDSLNPRSFTDLGPSQDYLLDASLIEVRPEPLNYNLNNGVWSPALQKIFYNYMVNTAKSNSSTYQDILGYVDKDVEKAFAVNISDKSGKTTTKTMINFDTWEEFKE